MRLITLIFFTLLLSCTAKANQSAYPIGPLYKGGYYHMIWMWRATESAATNSMLSYGRSKDLIKWESCGDKVEEIPISPNKTFLVEEGKKNEKGEIEYEGLVNNRQNISLVGQDVILTYVFNDENGTQIINAKKEGCEWIKSKITNNCEMIDIDKGGSLDVTRKINFSRIKKVTGKYIQSIKNQLRPCQNNFINGEIELNEDFSLKKIVDNYKVDNERNDINAPSEYLTVKKKINVKGTEITWFTKENIGDVAPSCYPSLCSDRDYSSPIYIMLDNNYTKITEKAKPIEVWGGSQAHYSFLKSTDGEGYLTYYDSNSLCLTVSKVKENEVTRSYCLEKNKNKWDSHNYIIMRQKGNEVYITGNAHNDDVNVYSFNKESFNKEKPDLIYSLRGSYTYPKFILEGDKHLLFVREGKSGNGTFLLFDFEDKQKVGKRIFSNG